MHAAWSVIAFTVLSGAGLGACALLALTQIAHALTGRGDASPGGLVALGIALALVIVGMCASVLHLANPRNAWRSASRFATSWLSREAVFAMLFLACACAWFALRLVNAPVAGLVLAIAACVLAWTVIVCTAMIYASLKPIRAWHTWRVPLNFALLAHASGATLVAVVLALRGDDATVLASIGAVLVAGAALAKWDYRRYLGGDRDRTSLESALGVAQGVRPPHAPATVAARILDAGHSRGTFLTREFVIGASAAHLGIARAVMMIGAYLLPFLWLADLGWTDSAAGQRGLAPLGLVVLVLMLCGLCAERWLFFVEARHTVRLYHGERKV
jgi:sulfite dehydrogenase (quinone) subunit SoeC